MQRTTARQDILEAADRLIGAHPRGELSMAQVRAAAQVSNGTLFHFFPTREHLIAALYLRAAEAYQRELLSALAEVRTAKAGIEGLVQAHVDWVLAHPGPAHFLHHGRRGAAAQVVEDGIRASNEAFVAGLGRWLSTLVAAGAVRALPLPVSLALLFGPVQMLTREWLRSGDAEALQAGVKPLADAIWRALAAPGRPGPLRPRRPAARAPRGRSTPRSSR